MVFAELYKKSQIVIAENSAALLTGTGVVGVITTAVLTGRATLKADQILREQESAEARDALGDAYVPLSTTEKVKLVGVLYLPAITSGITTIGAIVFSYRISMTRSAALAAAYGMSEKAFSEYKDKVLEHVTPKKAGEIKDAVDQQKIADNPPPSSTQLFLTDGEILCLDSFSGQYFKTNVQKIRAAENYVNAEIGKYNVASLGDFYEHIGMKQTDMSESFAWTIHNLLELDLSTQLTDDERPCLVLTFTNPPRPKYDDTHGQYI